MLPVWEMYLPRRPPVYFPGGFSLSAAYFTVVVPLELPYSASLTHPNNFLSKSIADCSNILRPRPCSHGTKANVNAEFSSVGVYSNQDGMGN